MAFVDGSTVRRVREALGEHQAKFGRRFGVHRRTIIRWEKSGTSFAEWGAWKRPDGKTPADLWNAATVKAEKRARARRGKKNSPQRHGRPKSPAGNRARRRRPVMKRARAARRRRGVTRRRR